MGTTLLGLPEPAVWRSSPRKLLALFDMHLRTNNSTPTSGVALPSQSDKQNVDALLSW